SVRHVLLAVMSISDVILIVNELPLALIAKRSIEWTQEILLGLIANRRVVVVCQPHLLSPEADSGILIAAGKRGLCADAEGGVVNPAGAEIPGTSIESVLVGGIVLDEDGAVGNSSASAAAAAAKIHGDRPDRNILQGIRGQQHQII